MELREGLSHLTDERMGPYTADWFLRSLARQQRARLPDGQSIIASSFTSPIDAVYLAAIFDPVFTASYPHTRRVERLSLVQAILRSFSYPEVEPPTGARMVDLATLLAKYPSRPVVVFPECTTTNGRGILPLSRCLVTVPPRTKIYPVSVRYTPADITTPVPGSYAVFLWNLLSKPTHCIRVRVAERVVSSSKSSSSSSSDAATARPSSTDFFYDEPGIDSSTDTLAGDDGDSSNLTREETALLDYVGEALARLGRVKRVGLSVQEKQDFVNMWARSLKRR